MTRATQTEEHDAADVCGAVCSRRAILSAFAHAALIPFWSACRSDGGMSPPPAGAVTITPAEVVIQLELLPGLRTACSAFVLSELQMIVVRLPGDDYRTFTNVCTHSGCGISLFETGRLKCQCHGSEFDIEGRNVAGPAPSPLRPYLTTFELASRTLVIRRSG